MKKVLFIVLLFLSLGLIAQDFPNPALCNTVTGEPIPTFFSIAYNFEGYEDGDWLGVYDVNRYCYGAMPFQIGFERGQLNGYGDDPDTDKKDGFATGSVMNLFLYDYSDKKFYSLSGIYTHGISGVTNQLVYQPMNLYKIDEVVKGVEVQLNVDATLSEVVFNFVALELPITTKGVDAIKLKFVSKNTANPLFTIAVGKGTLQNRWNGLYYKYAPDDVNVIINAISTNNFTGTMLTAKYSFTIDNSNSGVFEDENILFYLKGNELWIKSKTAQIAFILYRKDGGVEKKFYGWSQLRLGKEVRLLTNYSTWKGTELKLQYQVKQGGSFSEIIEKMLIL